MRKEQDHVDYKDTLNLPVTEFPMKANLSTREVERIEYWKKIDLYQKMVEKNKNNPPFILHDGPPYANGHLHLGHAVNKTLKDTVVKYQNMNGKLTSYIFGWDCHGLPIEIQVMKKVKKSETSKNMIRALCQNHAKHFIDIQKAEFERLLVIADPDKYYSTMSFSYEADILDLFLISTQKGYVYRGVKPVHWCPSCATALADAEIEYKDQESYSIYVSFPLNDVRSVLIWTTTPWSLPSNVALAFNKNIDYVVVKEKKTEKEFIVAKEMVSTIMTETGKDLHIIESISIDSIKKLDANHPFIDRKSVIVFADHVTLGSGTGIVHTAPGHGVEDFSLVKKYNLPMIMPINDYGKFTSEVKQWEGLFIKDANPLICEELNQSGRLFYKGMVKHSYPHCWRCKNSLMIRATGQFFIDIKANELQEKLIKSVKNDIAYVIENQRQRMLNVVADRPDWCISRQRTWGVPIPSIVCGECDHVFLNEELISDVAKRVRKEGLDFWFNETTTIKELFPFVKKCPSCGAKEASLKKGEDILDVWFDSGSSAHHILKMINEEGYKAKRASLYIEGTDQFRAWFQTSLILGLVEKNEAPYESILTHGSVLDEKGLAMSKSLGNVISPNDIVKSFGADILRLWTVSQDYLQDMKAGDAPIKQASESYRKIRNTFRFLLSNLFDYSEKEHKALKKEDYSDIDQWALHALMELSEKVHKSYEKYNLSDVIKNIFHFMNLDLSSFYLDILKNLLYTLRKDGKERRASQSVIYMITEHLVHLLAPIISFTCEEVYEFLPFSTDGIKKESIFLSNYDYLKKQLVPFENSHKKIETIRKVRDEVLKAAEIARQNKFINSNLEIYALVAIPHNEELYHLLKDEEINLANYFIVSHVYVDYRNRSSFKEFGFVESSQETIKGLKVYIYKTDESKCPRCWKYTKKQDDKLCDDCKDALKGS